MNESTANSDCGPCPAGDEPLEGSYFVSTYPPFSTWREDEVAAVHEVLRAPAPRPPPLGLYVHIPFCGERCRYCYYLSYANRPAEQIEDYLQAVRREAAMYHDLPALAGRLLTFIYFGGGTPSLLEPTQITRLIGELQTAFPWSDVCEATFECAPQSVTEEGVVALRAAGITRLSLGIQQLDDDVLKKNGRVHLVADVERAYPIIRQARFDVVNIDLMVGMLGESEQTFFQSLERVIDMQPESLTIYQLEIPHNTPLYRDLRDGSLAEPPPSWDVKRARVQTAFERLEQAGYSVRSAYAAVRNPQRHRFVYQDAQYHGADLLGLGVASFSYLGGVHAQNKASLRSYLEAVSDGALPLGRAHALSEDERLIREFVLQLKLGRARADYFLTKFGVDIRQRFIEPLTRMTQSGWLTIDDHGVSMTRRGLIRIDRLIPEFYPPRHQDVRYS